MSQASDKKTYETPTGIRSHDLPNQTSGGRYIDWLKVSKEFE